MDYENVAKTSNQLATGNTPTMATFKEKVVVAREELKMTKKEFHEEILELEAEIKSWGEAPRDLSKQTPWQNAILERSGLLMGWLFGNRPEPPPREEWRKTLPPRTVYRDDVPED